MAEYDYSNDETQIQFVNTHLEAMLTDILNDTDNLKKISQAFNSSGATLNGLTFQTPSITSKCSLWFSIQYFSRFSLIILQSQNYIFFFYPSDITDLMPFVNCSQFANYTAEISNGKWQCVGPCKTNTDYCHQHGQCLNDIHKGAVCR